MKEINLSKLWYNEMCEICGGYLITPQLQRLYCVHMMKGETRQGIPFLLSAYLAILLSSTELVLATHACPVHTLN